MVLTSTLQLAVTELVSKPGVAPISVVLRADLTDAHLHPALDHSQEDEMGNPCYVVVRLSKSAFAAGSCPATAPDQIGTAFRFYDGAVAAAFVGRVSRKPDAPSDRPESAESMATTHSVFGTPVAGIAAEGAASREEDDGVDAGDEAFEYDVSMTTVASLVAELYRRTEDLEQSLPGDTHQSRPAPVPVGGDATGGVVGAGPFAGWTGSGAGQVEVVRVRQRRRKGGVEARSDEEGEEAGGDSARQWEDAVKASAASAVAEEAGLSESARQQLVRDMATAGGAEPGDEGEEEEEAIVELVMRRLPGSTGGDGLLLRHAVGAENRVLPAHAALATEEGVSDGAAAAAAPGVLACSILLEADDERLGAEFEGDMVPFILRFDSPVDAARFRIAYDRARGAEEAEEEEAVPGHGEGSSGLGPLPALEARLLFVDVFRPYPFAVCRALSAEERQGKGLVTAQLAYSEVTFRGVADLLRDLRENLKLPTMTRGGGKFVDLGSGVGKAVLAAAMAHSFSEVVGVEMLQSLHEAAVHALDRYDEMVRPKLPPPGRRTAVQFLRDDFTMVPWLDADMVFCVSTTFDATVMSRIAALSNDMRRGALFVTTTTRLPSARWALVRRFELEMAHGSVTGFVHEKRLR